MASKMVKRRIERIARGRIEIARGNPLKVAIQSDDEWVFATIQQMAAERGVSFASIVRRLCDVGSDCTGTNGRGRRKGDNAHGRVGHKRKRVLALLKDGKPNGAPAMEIARKAEVAPQYVYRIMDDEAERLAVAHLLPKDGSLPDDLPLRAVKHMIPTAPGTV